MTQLFEPAFLEQQQAMYPELDVRAVAGAVREYAARYPVANANGLLVHFLTKQERTRRARLATRERADAAELDRYAELWVELLRLASTQRLGPGELLRCVEAARREGFEKLNARVSDRLRQLAARGGWPEAP